MSFNLQDSITLEAFPVGSSKPVQARRLAAKLELYLGDAPLPLALQHALRARVLDVRAVVAMIGVCETPHAAAVAVENLDVSFLVHACITRLRASSGGELRHRPAKEAAAARSLAEAIYEVPLNKIDWQHIATWLRNKGGTPKQRIERLRSARSFALFCEQEFNVRALKRACDDARSFPSEWCGGRFTVVMG